MIDIHDAVSQGWPEVNLLSLQITASWHRPTSIREADLGNVLRGAFGVVFRKLVCPPNWFSNDCAPCPLYSQCPYGQVFRPTPSGDATRMRKQADLPRPFVIRPQQNGDMIVSEERENHVLKFGLVLFGKAIDALPNFMVTLNELGKVGMGPSRTPFSITSVHSVIPGTSAFESLYDPTSNQMRRPERLIDKKHLLGLEPMNSDLQRELDFQTPTLLRTGSGVAPDGRRIAAREIVGAPPFGVLIRRLRDRLSSLCAFFAEEEWHRDDFSELGRLADEVELLDETTAWQHRSRRSSRTGQSHELSGFTGKATYRFPSQSHLSSLLPLIRYGELIHVGKNVVWGNGRIELLVQPIERHDSTEESPPS